MKDKTPVKKIAGGVNVQLMRFTKHAVYGVGGIDITSDGSFVSVVNAVENTISAIDTKTNKIASALSDPMFGSEPLGLTITPDSKWVYVANYKSNSISVIDTGYIAR